MCYVTKPQVWSGSKPENFPELSTSWPRERFFSFWMNKSICSRPVLIRVCMCEDCMLKRKFKREKEKNSVRPLWEKRDVGPSHVPNMGVFICRTVPQGSPESHRVPSVSSDFGRPGFCLHLVLSSLFRLHFILWFFFFSKSQMGLPFTPGK